MSVLSGGSACFGFTHTPVSGLMDFPRLYPVDVVQDVKEEGILLVETSLGCELRGIG